ncbi:plant invertase/pectin methylesterase inhibitor [Striga asiatica]|uniref:Plant invertase/pectin methylesterase inhibitor n=1 Tax=Striga asiatica TaxID=4170 RepID=A0A5A7QU70_STRAF|nr:plant invertase/pectin methylesterase inhibitor [Striga asiatica]
MKTSPLLLAAVLAAAAAFFLKTAAYTSSPPPNHKNTYKNFVLTQCNDKNVLYPHLCEQTLLPYANSIHGNLGKLAHKALNISLTRVQAMTSCISRQKSHDTNITAALADCNNTLATAQSYIKQSLQQMDSPAPPKQGGIVGENVKTWASAALTNEDTCKDGLSKYSTNTSSAAWAWQNCNSKYLVENVTSNALAFVNKYYSTPPRHPPPPPKY